MPVCGLWVWEFSLLALDVCCSCLTMGFPFTGDYCCMCFCVGIAALLQLFRHAGVDLLLFVGF